MSYAARLLTVFVALEVVVVGTLLVRTSLRTVPQIPDVELNDPLVMPQLRGLARAAEFGGSEEWGRLGEALVGKGFYAHAEQAFREALRLNSQNFAAQFGLAFSLDRSGRIEESSIEYRKVLQLHTPSEEAESRKYDAQYALGRNSLRAESPAEAETLFRQNAGYPPADYQVAKLLIRSGRAERSLPLIEKNLGDTPHSLEFHLLNHRAYLELGQSRNAFEAAAMVERSADVVSTNFNTEYVSPLDAYTGITPRLHALGEAAESDDLRRMEQIGVQIKSRLKGTPVFVERMVDEQLVSVAVRNQQPERTLELIDEMRRTGREDVVTLEHEGDARQMLGQADRAAELWERALTLTPSIRLHQKLAGYFAGKDVDQRDRHLSRTALLSGIAEYRTHRLEPAIPHLQEATTLNPEDPDAWFYLGELHFYLGRIEESRAAYRECLRLRPEHGRAAAKLSHLAHHRET